MEQYGETVVPPRTGKPGRPRKPFKQWPEGAAYGTVNKTFGRGEVVAAKRKLVHGTEENLARSLEASSCSSKINTSFVERHNGTDRCYNARKRRKTYEFSKDLLVHIAVSWWVLFCYNFHHLHRGLRQRLDNGKYLHRTPAMARGLAERPLTMSGILTSQVVGFQPSPAPTPATFRTRLAGGPAP